MNTRIHYTKPSITELEIGNSVPKCKPTVPAQQHRSLIQDGDDPIGDRASQTCGVLK